MFVQRTGSPFVSNLCLSCNHLRVQVMTSHHMNLYKDCFGFSFVKDQALFLQNANERHTELTSLLLLLYLFRLSFIYGGGRRDRTDDPLLAKQVLSQLSYAPRFRLMRRWITLRISIYASSLSALPESKSILSIQAGCLVGLVGLEPTTPALSRRCSNQLSYRPQPSNLFWSSMGHPTTDKCGYLAANSCLHFPERR